MRILLTFCALLLALSAFGSSEDKEYSCNKFRNGTFKIVDSSGVATIIKRQGDTQTEIDEARHAKIILDVKWTGDCTYTLKLRKVIQNDQEVPFDKEMTLTVHMTEVGEHSYSMETTSDKYDLVYKAKVIKTGN